MPSLAASKEAPPPPQETVGTQKVTGIKLFNRPSNFESEAKKKVPSYPKWIGLPRTVPKKSFRAHFRAK